jgi:hypothetical protein
VARRKAKPTRAQRANELARAGGFKSDYLYRKWKASRDGKRIQSSIGATRGIAARQAHGLGAYTATKGAQGFKAPGKLNSKERAVFFARLAQDIRKGGGNPDVAFKRIGSPKRPARAYVKRGGRWTLINRTRTTPRNVARRAAGR